MKNNENFKTLSNISYWIDSNRKEVPFIPKEGSILTSEDLKGLSKTYKALKISDNTSNGMQAMAVAPIKNGKDTSEIVIAYSGKSFSDKLDLHTDFQTIDSWKKCYS